MKKKVHNKWSLVLAGALLLLFAVFLVTLMIWENSLQSQEPTQLPTRTTAGEPLQTASAPSPTTLPPEATLPEPEARKLHFLLVGRDAHGAGENGRSDSMMLCSVDTGKKTITLISFLRDIYLEIPGHGSNRLNAAYSWGGAELLKETMTANFDVTIDVILEIDFEGFEGLIDRLGGVDITLTDREAEHMGGGLTEGVNHLDGKQALSYSRIRYLDSDFGRTERQRNVITALLEKYRSASFGTMLEVTDAFLDESTSDHSDRELLEYALELYATLEEAELITHRVPADGTYTYETIRGMSVVAVDFEKNLALLSELLQ